MLTNGIFSSSRSYDTRPIKVRDDPINDWEKLHGRFEFLH